jgi:hypothetical protein
MVGGTYEKDYIMYVGNKMQNFDGIVAPKVERRKWGWHLFFHIFTTIPSLRALAPTFPWTHNNNEAITICDGICNMERVGIFYLMPWCARFLRLYTFSKGIMILLIHLLHGGTEMNCKQWFFKGLNNKQCKQSWPLCKRKAPCCLQMWWGH